MQMTMMKLMSWLFNLDHFNSSALLYWLTNFHNFSITNKKVLIATISPLLSSIPAIILYTHKEARIQKNFSPSNSLINFTPFSSAANMYIYTCFKRYNRRKSRTTVSKKFPTVSSCNSSPLSPSLSLNKLKLVLPFDSVVYS